MSRLIDADAIADILCNLATEKWNKETGTTWANAYEEVMNMVDEQPTIDAVNVVRCKNCVYKQGEHHCVFSGAVDLDGYCHRGRRYPWLNS